MIFEQLRYAKAHGQVVIRFDGIARKWTVDSNTTTLRLRYSMGDQIWRKPRKLHLAVSARNKSTPALIRTARRSRRWPPITI